MSWLSLDETYLGDWRDDMPHGHGEHIWGKYKRESNAGQKCIPLRGKTVSSFWILKKIWFLQKTFGRIDKTLNRVFSRTRFRTTDSLSCTQITIPARCSIHVVRKPCEKVFAKALKWWWRHVSSHDISYFDLAINISLWGFITLSRCYLVIFTLFLTS